MKFTTPLISTLLLLASSASTTLAHQSKPQAHHDKDVAGGSAKPLSLEKGSTFMLGAPVRAGVVEHEAREVHELKEAKGAKHTEEEKKKKKVQEHADKKAGTHEDKKEKKKHEGKDKKEHEEKKKQHDAKDKKEHDGSKKEHDAKHADKKEHEKHANTKRAELEEVEIEERDGARRHRNKPVGPIETPSPEKEAKQRKEMIKAAQHAKDTAAKKQGRLNFHGKQGSK